MSQYDGNTAVPATWPGATMATDYFKLLGHVLSQGKGASRPVNLTAGGVWAKDVGGGDYELYLYDGTSDILIPHHGMNNTRLITCAAGGTANARTITTGYGLAALTAGQWFAATFAGTNTGAMTLAVDGLTAVNVKTVTAADTPAGYIRTDLPTLMFYDGTNVIAFREVEKGSNSNGEWIRWADGTQICSEDNVSTLSGSVKTVTLPASMASSAYALSIATINLAVSRLVTAGNKTSTTFDVESWNTTDSTNTVTPGFDYVAVGTWY